MPDTLSRVRVLLNARRFDEAKTLLQEICGKTPGNAQAWFLLGAVHGEQQQFDECARCSCKAISIEPCHVNAHYNLAQAYMHLGRPHDAVKAYRAVIEHSPNHTIALKDLGRALVQVCSFSEAVPFLERARALTPNDPEIHEDLGDALAGTGQTNAAITSFKAAAAIQPDLTSAHAKLVRLMGMEKRHVEALAWCNAFLHANPGDAGMLVSRGIVRGILGQVQEAREDYLRAIELAPEHAVARSALLMNMNYFSNDPEQLLSAHKDWDLFISRALQSGIPYGNDRDPERRLRIGYVSPNFYRHSVAYFFEPLLASHDANIVETYCYSHVEQPDAVTERLRGHAHHWREIQGMSPDFVADLVRRDSIDILVDLGGHTATNLLLIFARKPAPIQITWLGYPNTTGMKAMDFRITDEWADPVGIAEAHHTEALIRLPHGFLCYRPLDSAPPISPPPATQIGRITFGSFNTLQKITPEVLRTWARILVAVPGSRLVLKRAAFRHGMVAERYRQVFQDAGVEPDRVMLYGDFPSAVQHLEMYSQIDVGLDTFPYNGTTTTCEALWMGVPVVCLAGNRHAGRVGVSILMQVGLTDLIADNTDDYVRLAVELANDPVRLATLRCNLRERMKSSPLCDASGFARKIETAYRQMWRKWCAG